MPLGTDPKLALDAAAGAVVTAPLTTLCDSSSNTVAGMGIVSLGQRSGRELPRRFASMAALTAVYARVVTRSLARSTLVSNAASSSSVNANLGMNST